MPTKVEDGNEYHASAYLYVPDPGKPSTWKLRIEEEPGRITIRQLGRAAAALTTGFRGQVVDLPPDERRKCARKLVALYREQGVEDDDIPPALLRLAREGVKATALDDGTLLIEQYGLFFGSVDLSGERFTPSTDFDWGIYGPPWPVYYEHGGDPKIGTKRLGWADARKDEIGIWLRAQIERSDEYIEALRELLDEGRLGWSSGAVAHLVRRRGSEITRWPIVEFSLTAQPAEPKTLGLAQCKALGIEVVETAASEDAEAPQSNIKAEKTEEGEMTEILKKDLEALVQGAVEEAVKAALTPSPEPGRYAAQPLATETKSFGDWLRRVAARDDEGLRRVYGGATKAALTTEIGEYGGYLVPPEYDAQIRQIAAETAFLEPLVTHIPITGMVLQVPALDLSAGGSGTSPFFGGVKLSWTEEASALTETEPKFRLVELRLHQLGGYALTSAQLAKAAPSLDAFLPQLFGRALAWTRQYAFLRGDGVGKPLGMLNAPAAIAVSRASANKVTLADIAGMAGRMLPSSLGNAIWIAHVSVLPQLIQLQDAAGGSANTGNLIWIPNAAGAWQPTLLGRPLYFTEMLPSLGAAGDIMFVDPAFYLVGDGGPLAIATSEHYRFTNAQITWRIIDWVDGRPWLADDITLASGSVTVSPFVYLS